MIISRTPFRISFFGGGTDFPEFYKEHGGATLSTTIDKYCYISVHTLSRLFRHRFRASYAKTELVQAPAEFEHPLIRECLLFLDVNEGLEITHISDLPGRTGLGSSSSFTVGLLHALHTFRGETVSEEQLASEAICVERERVGDAGGNQDQYAAAYGGLKLIEYAAGKKITVKHVKLPKERIRELERHFMLFYTGTDNSAQSISREQKQRSRANEKVLHRMRELAYEAEAILLGSRPLAEFGKLLHETWEMKKTLSKGISNDFIDNAYDTARQHGAIGGKLLGAGGRGFLLVYADPDGHDAVRAALGSLPVVYFAFTSEGSRIIFEASRSSK